MVGNAEPYGVGNILARPTVGGPKQELCHLLRQTMGNRAQCKLMTLVLYHVITLILQPGDYITGPAP